MREYKIKRGHNPDINSLLKKYFGVDGDVSRGVEFEADGIGKINMRQEKNSLFVEIQPPKKITGDYEVIKKWNAFLFEATGKTAKERKKELGKI
ncbi:MAG TPA: hypothetical protein ENG62_00800 [Thermoplasmatales archaeon]|nr:hypothetical protein [Thermoplasmatales archaeon]